MRQLIPILTLAVALGPATSLAPPPRTETLLPTDSDRFELTYPEDLPVHLSLENEHGPLIIYASDTLTVSGKHVGSPPLRLVRESPAEGLLRIRLSDPSAEVNLTPERNSPDDTRKLDASNDTPLSHDDWLYDVSDIAPHDPAEASLKVGVPLSSLQSLRVTGRGETVRLAGLHKKMLVIIDVKGTSEVRVTDVDVGDDAVIVLTELGDVTVDHVSAGLILVGSETGYVRASHCRGTIDLSSAQGRVSSSDHVGWARGGGMRYEMRHDAIQGVEHMLMDLSRPGTQEPCYLHLLSFPNPWR